MNIKLAMLSAGVALMNCLEKTDGCEPHEYAESYEEIIKTYRTVKDIMAKGMGDITKLQRVDLLSLGFGKWDDYAGLYLIPIWMFDLIPDGTKLINIFGDTLIKGEDEIDMDTRFGCISCGIVKMED